jgi:ubiquinone/menaquinone biosynthesis C-methylase UbiE
MGRFATSVPYYSRYREPYPAAFFQTIAQQLHFSGRERLADLGCGPAPLAIGFARFVASCVGIDPEPAMLEAAREQSLEAGISLTLIQARIETIREPLGSFDIVTIGRALHWMEPQATLRMLDRIVVPGGIILVCGATPPPGPANPWLEAYNEVRRRWVDHTGEERYSADAEQRFAASRFQLAEKIVVTMPHTVTVDELVGRSLSRSTTSPEVLGDRLGEFKEALAQSLLPFATGGVCREDIEATGRVFKEVRHNSI